MKKYLFLYILIFVVGTGVKAQDLRRIEYFFDADPGIANGITIPSDGLEDTIQASIDISSLSLGAHKIYVRTQDEDGVWSLTASRIFYIKRTNGDELATLHYDFDKEPSPETSTSYTLNGLNDTIQDKINVGNLSDGLHTLYARGTAVNGKETQLVKRIFYVHRNHGDDLATLTYCFDEEPGSNNKLTIPVEGLYDSVQHSIDVSNLKSGMHVLYARGFAINGKETQLAKRLFYIKPRPSVKGYEYLFTHNGDTVQNSVFKGVHSTVADTTINSQLDVTNLQNKRHYTVYMRGIDGDGYKSEPVVAEFLRCAPESITLNESATVYDGFTYKDVHYTNDTIVIDSLTNFAGCDSVVTVNIDLYCVEQTSSIDTAISVYEQFVYGDSTYTQTTTIVDTLINSFGCDSILTINLDVFCIEERTSIDTNVHVNTGFVYKGVHCSNDTVLIDTLANCFGCDSILTINVMVSCVEQHTTIDTAISVYEHFEYKGKTYTTSTTISDTLSDKYGCDSIVTINLTTYCEPEPFEIDTSVSVCNGYVFEETTYYENTVLTETLTNRFGCDSIISHKLTVYDEKCSSKLNTMLSIKAPSVFPNPVSSELTIESSERIIRIKISTLSGCIISSQTVYDNTVKMDFSRLRKGVYILLIEDEQQQTHREIVVKK